MALDKPTFKAGMLQLITDMRTRTDAATGDDEYATRLIDLIEAFIKSGDGVYQNGTLQQSGTVGVVAIGEPIVKIQ